eukprot:6190616-Pleurochrysis_carterae.AAC.1
MLRDVKEGICNHDSCPRERATRGARGRVWLVARSRTRAALSSAHEARMSVHESRPSTPCVVLMISERRHLRGGDQRVRARVCRFSTFSLAQG